MHDTKPLQDIYTKCIQHFLTGGFWLVTHPTLHVLVVHTAAIREEVRVVTLSLHRWRAHSPAHDVASTVQRVGGQSVGVVHAEV